MALLYSKAMELPTPWTNAYLDARGRGTTAPPRGIDAARMPGPHAHGPAEQPRTRLAARFRLHHGPSGNAAHATP